MTRLTWSEPETRTFETGLDRGVLYPKLAPPVPWNGLTSVDEEGADAASEFYMDGRPFLYLPKAKEFRATLNAYTYPDEFAELAGLVEVADGLYLDSQVGDSFGLSYRTLIGNASGHGKAAYKIHVLYNVTMAPQGATYETLSTSSTPTTFSWAIQAVPVPIVGYRPTAHIIIDTRHIDTQKRAAVEAALYGTVSTTGSLPEAQDLIDMLAYGAGVVITDNGDGTWTAAGSYTNVHKYDDGTFEINNVSAIGYGDGTYDISSTP